MSAGVHSLRRAGLTGCVGGSMAALGYAHTGLIAALPAATGLAALAASDLATRRLSLRTLRTSAVLVGVGLVLDSGRTQAWDRLLAAPDAPARASTRKVTPTSEATSTHRDCQARTGPTVAHVPDRVPKVSPTYRSHAVHHEPGQHTTR